MSRRNQISARTRYGLRRTLYHGRQALSPGNPNKSEISNGTNQELITTKEQLAEVREHAIRQRSDFDNFRKRTQREKEQIRDAAAEMVIAKLLPVLDNMQRALVSADAATDVKPVRDGVRMILSQFERALEAEGLAAVESLHQPFDPTLHDALATEEREDVPDNHVCEVLLPGYTYKDKLIRAAMVKVAKARRNGEVPTSS